MLEATAILFAHGPCKPEPAPKPLLGNGQLCEDQKIFIGRPVSAALNIISERPDDARLHCSPRACRGSPVAALSLSSCASFIRRGVSGSEGRPTLPPCCRLLLARDEMRHFFSDEWRQNVGNIHTTNALVLYLHASGCKTPADVAVQFVTRRYRAIRQGETESLGTKRTGSRSAEREADIAAPAAEKGNEAEGQVGWVLEACSRVLRPVVRLALAYGLKHSQLELTLRELLIDEARRAWRQTGTEPNISQLSVTTGLNRKAVTTKVREAAEPLPHTEMSAAAKALTLWLQRVADDPTSHVLPITAEGETASFEALARQATHGNVHHRSILDELLRLDMVIEHAGSVELNAAAFVPSKDLKSMLAFLGDNARDHLFAGVANTLGAQPPLLERSVFATGIPLEDCERIHQRVRERWGVLHNELTHDMTRAFEAAGKDAKGRIRVGIYTYYEDSPDE